MTFNAAILQQSCLNEHQVVLLKKSFRQMNSLNVAAKFYKKLFEQHPGIVHLFPPDNRELVEKLVSVLELVVFSFEKKTNDAFGLQDNLTIPLRDLGRKHERKGVLPEHYPIANTILLQAIEEELVTDTAGEIKNAWQIALDQLSSAMLNSSIDRQPDNHLPDGSFFRQIVEALKRKSMSP